VEQKKRCHGSLLLRVCPWDLHLRLLAKIEVKKIGKTPPFLLRNSLSCFHENTIENPRGSWGSWSSLILGTKESGSIYNDRKCHHPLQEKKSLCPNGQPSSSPTYRPLRWSFLCLNFLSYQPRKWQLGPLQELVLWSSRMSLLIYL